jgi:hypothetical protein
MLDKLRGTVHLQENFEVLKPKEKEKDEENGEEDDNNNNERTENDQNNKYADEEENKEADAGDEDQEILELDENEDGILDLTELEKLQYISQRDSVAVKENSEEAEEENDSQTNLEKYKAMKKQESMLDFFTVTKVKKEALQRLVKRPRDEENSVKADMDAYVEIRKKFLTEIPRNSLNSLSISAYQSMDKIAYQFKQWFSSIGVRVHPPNIVSRTLQSVSGGVKGNLEDIERFLSTTFITENTPKRDSSLFGVKCPVSLVDEQVVVECDGTFSASYKVIFCYNIWVNILPSKMKRSWKHF